MNSFELTGQHKRRPLFCCFVVLIFITVYIVCWLTGLLSGLSKVHLSKLTDTSNSMMNHSMHDHSMIGMDHNQMDHSEMDHSQMDHSQMDHSQMDHSSMDHSNMNHTGMDMMDHGMKMYFHFSTHATILFKGWQSTDWQGMLGSCVAVFIMAALYEGLKVSREYLLRRSYYNVQYTNAVPTTEDTVIKDPQERTMRARMLSLAHIIQTVLHILQIVVSYFLMLIFMTYNVYLCIAVALGAGVGYFLFAWKRAIVIDVNEHCH